MGKLRTSIANRIANIIDPTRNSARGVLTGREFLRNGGGRSMAQDWSYLIMNEPDKYTGLMYAAIEKRANLVVRLADENLRTKSSKAAADAAKKRNEILQHPYLPIIDSSLGFSDYEFWHNIPVYLDLKGVYYLGVIRTVAEGRVGEVQSFEMLNPYQVARVTRIVDGKVEVGGYREWQGAYYRDWPVQQIIDMRKLNPFNPDEPYSMSDAGKDSQFTLKQAGDYTRRALRNNAGSPGIYSTDVVLEDEMFEMFVARIRQTDKGEPIIANGAGAVKWNSTQIEMDKAALDKITQINVEPLLAVSATSKTSLGIEQSGVTRDTSKVMSDQLTTDAGMPLLRFIIEALNQDYKRYYPDKYRAAQYKLYIDSPLGKDRDAEAKDVEIRGKSLDLYQALINRGYEAGVAAKYAIGEISLEELGAPTKPPLVQPVPAVTPSKDEPKKSDKQYLRAENAASTEKPISASSQPLVADLAADQALTARTDNQLAADDVAQLASQEAALQNTVEQAEEQIALAVIEKVAKNLYDEASDVLAADERAKQERELIRALLVFYSLVVPLQAKSVMQRRTTQYGVAGTFAVDAQVRKAIQTSADKAAESHVQTIVEDLRATVKQTMVAEGDISRIAEAVAKKYPAVTTEELRASVREAAKGGKSDSEIAQALRAKYKDASFEELLKGVRAAALKGAEHDDLVRAIRREYQEMAKTRASVIAKTETNRAFSMSQYEADRQFLAQNDWTERAYKRLLIRSPHPCVFCQAKAAEGWVPFLTPFANLGDVITATVKLPDGSTSVKTLAITYATIEAGNLHVLCQCGYELEIR